MNISEKINLEFEKLKSKTVEAIRTKVNELGKDYIEFTTPIYPNEETEIKCIDKHCKLFYENDCGEFDVEINNELELPLLINILSELESYEA